MCDAVIVGCKARFTLATPVVRLQIFAKCRFTLATNFVRLQARKRKNHHYQVINNIYEWFSTFHGL